MTDELEKNIFISGYRCAVKDMWPYWIRSIKEIEKRSEKAYAAMLKRQEEFKNEK